MTKAKGGTEPLALTVGDLLAMERALEQIREDRLPAVTGFRLSQIARLIAPHLAAYREQEAEYFKSHGKETPAGLRIEVGSKEAKGLQDLREELAAVEVEVSLPYVRIEDLRSNALPLSTISGLYPVLQE